MALLQEAPVMGRAEARSLLLHGKDTPQLLVPKNEVEKATLVPATRIEDVPVESLQQSALNAAFVVKTIHFQEPNLTQQEEPSLEEKKPTRTLLTVSFEEGSDPLEMARRVDRGMQRAKQYEKIVKQLGEWEVKMVDGKSPVLPFASTAVTPDLIHRLKQIAGSMYVDELTQEGLTHELAKDLRAKQVLKEDAVLEAVEALLFPAEETPLVEVNVVHETITETKVTPATQNAASKNKEATEAETQSTQEESSKAQEMEEQVLYVHDEFDDEPSIKAAIFFTGLLNRPLSEREKEADIVLPDKPRSDAQTKYIPLTEIWNRNF